MLVLRKANKLLNKYINIAITFGFGIITGFIVLSFCDIEIVHQVNISSLIEVCVTIVFVVYITTKLNKKNTLKVEIIKDFLIETNSNIKNIKTFKILIKASKDKINKTQFIKIQSSYKDYLDGLEQLKGYIDFYSDINIKVIAKLDIAIDTYKSLYDSLLGDEFDNNKYSIDTIDRLFTNFDLIIVILNQVKRDLIVD